MRKKKRTDKKSKGDKVKITVVLTSEQYKFIEENNIDPNLLLKKTLNLKKQKILQDQRQLRANKFNNEFKKIKPKVDVFLRGKKLNDSLWSMRYRHARTLTRSHFISYGGPLGDKLYELFVEHYTTLLKKR